MEGGLWSNDPNITLGKGWVPNTKYTINVKTPSATWSLSASSGRGVNLSSWQRKMAAMPPLVRLHFQIFWTNPQLLRLTISPWVCKVRLRKNLFAANFVMSFDTAQKQKRGLFKCLQVSTVRHCGSKVLYNSLHPEISKSSQSNPTTSATSICDGVLLLLFQKSKFSTLLKKLSFAEERCKMRPCQGRRSRWRWWGRWPWWRWVSGCRCLCPENHVKTHRILGRYVIYVIWYTYMICHMIYLLSRNSFSSISEVSSRLKHWGFPQPATWYMYL